MQTTELTNNFNYNYNNYNFNNNYYIVDAKCGHVGRDKYVLISFAIEATSGKEAARIARELPRVKHDHKDAIINVRKVSYEEYLAQYEINNNDSYLHCKSVQEQNRLVSDIDDRLIDDPHSMKESYNKYSKEERKARIEYKKKKEKSRYDFYS